MLPNAILNLIEKFRLFPGLGFRSSQKLALDILQMKKENFQDLMLAMNDLREKVRFCQDCGFFAQGEKCEICQNTSRNVWQICLVEKPTDVISLEKSEIYKGRYHVLQNLISPLDNIFPEDTSFAELFLKLENLLKTRDNQGHSLELVLFFKNGFSAEATTTYLKEKIKQNNWEQKVKVSRLAQGLPLYFNPDTLDQATMIKAFEDRREVDYKGIVDV